MYNRTLSKKHMGKDVLSSQALCVKHVSSENAAVIMITSSVQRFNRFFLVLREGVH